MDYYCVLEIPIKSNIDEVKKAYKRLALIYHPDKPTGNRELFEKIHKAYQVLSDPYQKKIYDSMYDIPDDDQSFNVFISNLFDNVLANINKMKKERKKKEPDVKESTKKEPDTKTNIKRVKPIITKVNITLDELYRGDIKKLLIRVRKDDSWRKESFFINLMEHKKKYIFFDQGDEIYGYKGDLEIVINILEHEKVKIDNVLCEYDLYIEEDMSLIEYYYGIKRDIYYLDNEIIHVDIKDIYTGNKLTYIHVVEDKGLPYIENDKSDKNIYYGNLYIYFTIKLPESINDLNSLIKENVDTTINTTS